VQVFSGFLLKELKAHVDEKMASGKPVPSAYYDGEVVKIECDILISCGR